MINANRISGHGIYFLSGQNRNLSYRRNNGVFIKAKAILMQPLSFERQAPDHWK
jgi:hypothetical protein